MEKYTTSKIDNNVYCRKNGQFYKHLQHHGFSYQTYYDTFLGQREYCPHCSGVRVFEAKKMQYKLTCGSPNCSGKNSSLTKANYTEEQKAKKIQAYRDTMSKKTPEELDRLNKVRKKNVNFNQAKVKRELTCEQKNNDPKYNNSSQISNTKLNWTPQRKQLFLERLRESLDGGWMSDFQNDDTWIKRRNTLEQKNLVTPKELLSNWTLYKNEVRRLTERSYKRNIALINPLLLPRGTAGFDGVYHLDHIIPIKYGFDNNIDPIILSHPRNLQMLPWKQNISKGTKIDRHVRLNVNELQILSDEGFVPFDGVSYNGKRETMTITFIGNNSIRATPDHVFFDISGMPVNVSQLTIGDVLLGNEHTYTIQNIHVNNIEDVYDILESKNHKFIANDLITHNCEFLSSDQLLIDTTTLQQLTNRDVIDPIKEVNGFKFWDEIRQGNTYIVGIDPATGTGNDFTVIQVFQFPSMVQIAEFRSNTMSSPEVYRKLKWLLDTIEQRSGTVYFSVENNGVGEGIIALYLNDDNPPEFSEFVTEDSSNGGRGRPGFSTNGRKKMKACVDVKQMLESGKMILRSAVDIKEFKNFVRKRDSYQAQIGSTDDCICAILICIRILTEIASFEQSAFDKLYSYQSDDYNEDPYDDSQRKPLSEEDEPLPFVF